MILSRFADNPLRERTEVQRAVADLWVPLRPLFIQGGAATQWGDIQASYGKRIGSLESIARPLWGLVPLSAGGGLFHDWNLYRHILTAGVDPQSPMYWGEVYDNDQRAVEMAAIAFGILLLPNELWAPLTNQTKQQLSRWLYKVNEVALYNSNWLFFRLIVNAALHSVGERVHSGNCTADRASIDSFYQDAGWFTDGCTSQRDYYVPMAMHFYGLLLSKLDTTLSLARKETTVHRARLFAEQFTHWFSSAGAAVPFGRSLTYRFAQGAFWGALAFADVDSLPWGQIKGLYLRHLRFWLGQPIFNDTGLLSVGYAYPNNIMAEAYNGPGSPYWAFKAFLPLALPAEHPFWQSPEEPLVSFSGISIQRAGGFVLCRDAQRDHVFALASQQVPISRPRHCVQKYSKFVYSSAFGFNVPVGGSGPESGAGDSTILVSIDQRDWRARETFDLETWAGETQHTRWSPFPQVQIDSWISPALPGHVRVHRIKTLVTLHTFEGGFPIERDEQLRVDQSHPGEVRLDNARASSVIRDLLGSREGRVAHTEPGTNLLYPLTSVPGLIATLVPGETWLFTAVIGLPGENQVSFATRWCGCLHALSRAEPPQINQNETPVLFCRINAEPNQPLNRGHALPKSRTRSRTKHLLRKVLGKVVRKLGLKR